MERYVGLYAVEEVVSSNAVKLRLPSSMRIHLVMNVSRIVCYKEQVKEQKKEEGKLVEVDVVVTTRHSRTNDLTTSKAFQ